MASRKNKSNEPDLIEKKRPSENADTGRQKLSETKVQPSEKSRAVTHVSDTPVKPSPDSIGNQIVMFVMIILAIFFAFCLLLTNMSKGVNGISGPIGYYTCCLLYGAFGYGAWIVPLVFVSYAVFWKKSVAKDIVVPKIVVGGVFVASFSSFVQSAGLTVGAFDRTIKFWDLAKFWDFMAKSAEGAKISGGGIVGGFVGGMLYSGFKTVSLVVTGVLLLASVMLVFEITPAKLGKQLLRFIKWFVMKIRLSYSRAKERREAAREAAALEALEAEKEREAEEKAQQVRLAREKAERERAEKEKAERERAELERAERDRAEKEETKKGYDISSYADHDKKDISKAINTAASVNVSDTKIKKTVEVTPVDLEKISVATPVSDVAVTKREESFVEEDVKEIFTDDKKDELKAGMYMPPSEKEFDIDGNELRKTKIVKKETIVSESAITPNEFDDLPVEIMEVERETVFEEVESREDKPYELPPIELLSQGDTSDGDSPEELEANAKRLVEVLRSFKVDVEIVHISHGPTITRYEVAPKAGVKVRSIAGLVDDIALNMKTSGVRIEPIPGKVAVGIEVPNRCRATVFLRNLIDTEQFRSAKSKVTCALGVNVAGEPVFLDIAKMPHLLIAGATGMGKSVCINSLLISLLYRAKPDEVKLILIDPKKVELNTYNKLPHLLVPVLNAPQKAAGALAWAVIEMERRFSLIEQYGVRNLAGYNSIAAENEDMEILPHIIIVIDELADLMMQAHDDVEDSICRLAAKARAAGMHMIVGTQRPSVDVITGLIKANIPSRIAFTVASNADSRTIIDIAGAEKLIGRGDMLYAPVQEMKPLRLQGSFVSDSEVEKVVSFINEQCEVTYDSDIIDEIEEQAALCGEKKKKGGFGASSGGDGGSDDGELDSKFYEAVELAVDEKKISTSLIQRKLSLGYGRAAKIIDEMEKRGIVSAPDGQKPRTVLISQQDYYEMRIRHNMSDSSYSDDE